MTKAYPDNKKDPRSAIGAFFDGLKKGSSRGRVPYDPDKQYPVIVSSICTGEKVAGFKNREDGHFTDVMLIRHPGDIERFKEMYGLTDVRTEY